MIQKSVDILRVLSVIIGAFSQVILGGLPFFLGWEHTIASRSSEAQTLVIPANYAFSIWSFLFLGCLVFAVLHALPKYQSDPLFRKVGWLAAIAFLGNALWEVYVPIYSFDLISLVIILIIFSALLSAMFILRDAKDNRWVFVPLMLLAGWISVATFVNISVTTNFLSFNPFALSLKPKRLSLLLLLV